MTTRACTLDNYSAIVRLVEVGQRRAILWEYEPPMFERREAGAALHRIAAQLTALPLTHYPRTTHVEAHLVSVGDVLLASEPSS